MIYKTAKDSRIRLLGSKEASKQQANTNTTAKGNTSMSIKAPNYHRAINQLSDSDIHELTTGLEYTAAAKRKLEEDAREFAISGRRQELEIILGRPLADVPEEALMELTDVVCHLSEMMNNPLGRADLRARLEREVKAVEEREKFRKALQYTSTRLLAGDSQATQHIVTLKEGNAVNRFKRSVTYKELGPVSLLDFAGVQITSADGFKDSQAARDLLEPPTSAATLFKDERTQYLHEGDTNRIHFWKSLNFNFVNRPRGAVIAALVNDGSIRDRQVIDLERLHRASTRGFTCSPQVGDRVEWLNVIFNDEADAHYVLNLGDLAEFGWVSSIEKVLP